MKAKMIILTGGSVMLLGAVGILLSVVWVGGRRGLWQDLILFSLASAAVSLMLTTWAITHRERRRAKMATRD